MNKMLIHSVAALLCVPLAAHAQAYKCKQPDGSTAFQDHPCAAGSIGSEVDLLPAQGYSSDDANRGNGSRSDGSGGHSRRSAGQGVFDGAQNNATNAANDRIEAENRQIRCNEAVHNLGVLKEERPVYHYDKNGNKVYVEDSARAAAVAAAQQRVSALCK